MTFFGFGATCGFFGATGFFAGASLCRKTFGNLRMTFFAFLPTLHEQSAQDKRRNENDRRNLRVQYSVF
ncbi:MAG: hypothetical protein IJ774_07425, partial [Selenomonadaceae bacterium]|nr:hypothetical protein [Selenomonadaceae bacterium]